MSKFRPSCLLVLPWIAIALPACLDASSAEPAADVLRSAPGEHPGRGDDHRRRERGPVVTRLEWLGTYATGVFDQGAAEIVDHHPGSQRLFVVDGAAEAIDVVAIDDPSEPTLVTQLAITEWGGSPNSVAISGDVVAVAVEAPVPSDPGVIVFFDAHTLAYINDVQVGALPDMVTFSPDGTKVLVACEGEPMLDYAYDPEGTIAILDVSGPIEALTDADVQFADFSGFSSDDLDPGVRIFGPGSTVAQDLEPEYIAVSPDSATAWVTLQENNAIAVIDVADASVIEIVALGSQDHRIPGHGLDPSDADNTIAIGNWPVFGMVQPDAIASFQIGAETFLITANEGDAREYGSYTEEARVKTLALDPVAFPNAAALKTNAQLGRLSVTTTLGDLDHDGDFDELHAFGSRSIAIWTSQGEQVWDSGDLIERQTALASPEFFNSNHATASFDNRSDNKGPEPEGVTVARLWGKPYAFVGLERIGGVMVFDLRDPHAPAFVLYDNSTRDFHGVPEAGSAGDLGPEGLHVIAAQDSPIGEPLLAVANEVSGTVSVYRIVGE